MARFLPQGLSYVSWRQFYVAGVCRRVFSSTNEHSYRKGEENSVNLSNESILSEGNIDEYSVPLDQVVTKESKNTNEMKKGKNRVSNAKQLCYYFTQGLCGKGGDESHLRYFSHSFPDLPVRESDVKKLRDQPFKQLLVLDLEGKEEIVEFPVVLLDVKTLQVVDRFHRFVRPTKLSVQRQNAMIKGKYGKWKVDKTWKATAVDFADVVPEFESWMDSHGLRDEDTLGMKDSAFVTCGNWDIKTKILEQCRDSEIALPPYFLSWINIKDIFLNHYNRKPSGMKYMLEYLGIRLQGNHHMGLDDAHNITRLVQRMLLHRARFRLTGRRTGKGVDDVEWLCRRRVK